MSSSSSSQNPKPAPSETELSEQDLDAVSGGAAAKRTKASDSCSETGDSGMMGCPG